LSTKALLELMRILEEVVHHLTDTLLERYAMAVTAIRVAATNFREEEGRENGVGRANGAAHQG
jgi:hypothetical protein